MDNKNGFAEFFKQNMTSLEMRKVYFSLVDDLSEDEKEELEKAYRPAFEDASRREFALAGQGWMFGG